MAIVDYNVYFDSSTGTEFGQVLDYAVYNDIIKKMGAAPSAESD